MNRMPLTFECQGRRCGATLDNAAGSTGLLIVTGGNEIRAGTFNGQARLAAFLAHAGYPVFRFDRRGIGDSDGENRGFRKSRKDIAAALAAFRVIAPHVQRVVGFGNCDAASAIMLASGEGFDALVLSNPWTIEDNEDATPSPSAIRSRYLSKLRNPREVARLLSGGVNLSKLVRGLATAAQPGNAPTGLAAELRESISPFTGRVDILLAGRDRTAQVFAERWTSTDYPIQTCTDADHSYSDPAAQEWLRQRLLEALSA